METPITSLVSLSIMLGHCDILLICVNDFLSTLISDQETIPVTFEHGVFVTNDWNLT